MLDGQTIKQLATVNDALSVLATNPALLPANINAVRGCIMTIQSVEQRQKGAHLQVVPSSRPRPDFQARPRLPRTTKPDVRARQLPVGDRDGGHDDAA